MSPVFYGILILLLICFGVWVSIEGSKDGDGYSH
jgi:hypothetical protein